MQERALKDRMSKVWKRKDHIDKCFILAADVVMECVITHIAQ